MKSMTGLGGVGWFGVLCLLVGVVQVWTHVRRRQWPLVQASLDSVEGHVDVTPAGEDIAIQPRYRHQLRYTYHGRTYPVELPDRELHVRTLHLRVNPKSPEEALFEDQGLFFPVLVICAGIVLIAISVRNVV